MGPGSEPRPARRGGLREEATGTAGAGGLGSSRPGRAGRGAGGRGARFRDCAGRAAAGKPGLGPRPGVGVRGQGPGAGAAGREQQVGRGRGGAAAGGRPEECRAGGPGAPRRQEEPSAHLERRLRVRPLRAEDACPRVASSRATAGG